MITGYVFCSLVNTYSYSENGGSIILQIFGPYLPNYTTSYPKIQLLNTVSRRL